MLFGVLLLAAAGMRPQSTSAGDLTQPGALPPLGIMVGQMLMVGVPGTSLDQGTINLIKGRRTFLAMIDERLRSMGFVEKTVDRSRYLSRPQ